MNACTAIELCKLDVRVALFLTGRQNVAPGKEYKTLHAIIQDGYNFSCSTCCGCAVCCNVTAPAATLRPSFGH
jgi:hypothetical protein